MSQIHQDVSSDTSYVTYKSASIFNKTDGRFLLQNVTIFTDTPDKYVVVVNVWGVESSYDDAYTQVTIKLKTSWFDDFFAVVESYFAFIIAAIFILTVSYEFPFYLVPLPIILMGLFLVYVYWQVDSKGVMFVSIIFILMISSSVIIILSLVMKLFYHSKWNSNYFYD